MRIVSFAGFLIALQIAISPALAADDLSIERLAMCQDSWLDWRKNDPDQVQKFAEHFQSDFLQNESDPFFVPKARTSIAGLGVTKVFPDSVGMGVGFSVMVDATFDETRRNVEKALGKSLKEREVSDNMRTCALEIAEKRTLTLMSDDDPKSSETLLGCYYYYEK